MDKGGTGEGEGVYVHVMTQLSVKTTASHRPQNTSTISFIGFISSDWVRVLMVLPTESNLLIQNCRRMSTSAQIENFFYLFVFIYAIGQFRAGRRKITFMSRSNCFLKV